MEQGLYRRDELQDSVPSGLDAVSYLGTPGGTVGG